MENLEICAWKKLAEKDKEKINSEDSTATLVEHLDKCYNCIGTKDYATKIDCDKFYVVKK